MRRVVVIFEIVMSIDISEGAIDGNEPWATARSPCHITGNGDHRAIIKAGDCAWPSRTTLIHQVAIEGGGRRVPKRGEGLPC